jgi:hypothetical protein
MDGAYIRGSRTALLRNPLGSTTMLLAVSQSATMQ